MLGTRTSVQKIQNSNEPLTPTYTTYNASTTTALRPIQHTYLVNFCHMLHNVHFLHINGVYIIILSFWGHKIFTF